MRRLNKSLLIPLFLALLPAVVIIMLLPPMFQKYDILENATYIKEKTNSWVTYYDIDNDGKNELIKTIDTEIGNAAIMIFKSNGKLINQYNYPGSFVKRNRTITFGDYNNDSIAEMYFFTRRKDSVFMQLLCVNNHPEPVLEDEFFIDRADKTKDGIFDVRASIHKIINIDESPEKELLIDISGYYSILPRKVGILNLKTKDKILTRNFASKVSIRPLIDQSTAKYLITSGSHANIEDPNQHHGSDMKDELFLLDNRLNIIKGPVTFGHYRSYGLTKIFPQRQQILTAYAPHERIRENIKVELKLFDYNLNLVKENTITVPNKHRQFVFLNPGNNPSFVTKEKVYIIDSKNLNITDKKKQDLMPSTLDLLVDIDNDTLDELLGLGHYKLYVLDHNMNILAIRGVDMKNEPNTFLDLIPNKKGNQVLLQNEEEYHVFSIHRNWLYEFKYLLYLAIYLISFAFTFLVFYLSKRNSEKKYAMEREMANLQLQSIRSQASPHFTFNLLNSISAAILKEEKDKAQSMLSSIAELMRDSLETSEKIERSLKNELDFVNNYLKLEQQRYNDHLDYRIEIEEEVDTSIPIPKMLLQIFVENAIKHGIRPLKDHKGMITIYLRNSDKGVIISIQDNGVGRQFAEKNGVDSTKTGLKIADKIIGLHEKMNDYKIKYNIMDLYDHENKATGTKVLIDIPLKT